MENPSKGSPGRPSDYSDQIADEIVRRIAAGDPLAKICREEGIGRTTVYAWREAHPEFSERFARARLIGFDAIAEDALEIADEQRGDPVRDKLRVWTRFQLLAKWDPKRYGERVATEITGANGGPVKVEEIRRTVVDPEAGAQ